MSILFETFFMKINRTSPQNNIFLQTLNTIDKSPKKLYFIGELPQVEVLSVAIVGSRRPTNYGKEVTYKLAYELARQGVVIVSGLALGVDAIAHKAALDAGGRTIAVLANGLDKIYPASNQNLANDIVKSGGAIISEYEPGVEPRDFRFLERNRLVSGLSKAVVVTEAASRSGTISTITHALNQGREVFAVPGNITSPLSAGCNNLIKQGATPITCYQDILEVIAPNMINQQSILPLGNNPTEVKILELLSSGIRDGEELCKLSEVDTPAFLRTMTEMELTGLIRPLGGNQWAVK